MFLHTTKSWLTELLEVTFLFVTEKKAEFVPVGLMARYSSHCSQAVTPAPGIRCSLKASNVLDSFERLKPLTWQHSYGKSLHELHLLVCFYLWTDYPIQGLHTHSLPMLGVLWWAIIILSNQIIWFHLESICILQQLFWTGFWMSGKSIW